MGGYGRRLVRRGAAARAPHRGVQGTENDVHQLPQMLPSNDLSFLILPLAGARREIGTPNSNGGRDPRPEDNGGSGSTAQ